MTSRGHYPRLFLCAPSMGVTSEGASPSDNLATGSQVNRKGVTARERPKEAGSEAAGRWTRTGYEALKRVKQNHGGPGVDGMTVEELPAHLRAEWPRSREELLAGTYRPSDVLRREIPKAGGGVRELGIPTVVDRFVQQAILQVLRP